MRSVNDFEEHASLDGDSILSDLATETPHRLQGPSFQLKRLGSFLAPKLHQVGQFVMKQGVAMAGNLLYGLLCVRMLPKSEYAMFGVLFGFMGSLTVLLDIGVASTLAPLVGDQVSNLQLVANYIASIRRIALRMYLVVAPAAMIVFVLLVYRQHWGALVIAQMLLVLMVTAWFARVSSSYGSVLTVLRDRGAYYRVQMMGSLGSLALLLTFWAFHRVNVYVGILLNVAQVIFLAASYYRRARQLLGVQGTASQEQERAIVRLALPNAPSTIFYALQGQVTLMLITVLGHSTASIANISALGRLSQILVFLSQMNPILVEPFFSRLAASRLKRTYLLSATLAAVFATVFSALAFAFPQIFLWLLGPKYSQLHVEVGLVVMSSSIQFVAGFLWTIHSARRFVYWWNNIGIIVLTLAVQAGFVLKMDLSTVKNVLIMSVATSAANLVLAICCGVYGFLRGPQKMVRAAA
jgi:hypothetical protein